RAAGWMRWPVRCAPANAAGADQDEAAVPPAMRADACRLGIGHENRHAIGMLVPARSLELAGFLAPANATQATTLSKSRDDNPAPLMHWIVAWRTEAKLSPTPRRILARPPTPSLTVVPAILQRRARQRLPPPSIPSKRTSARAFI